MTFTARSTIIPILNTVREAIVRISGTTTHRIYYCISIAFSDLNTLLQILVAKPFIPYKPVSAERKSRHSRRRNSRRTRAKIRSRYTKIIEKIADVASSLSGKRYSRNNKICTVLRIILLATHLYPIVPYQATRNKKEKRFNVKIIHKRNDRSCQTAKFYRIQCKSIARQNLIDKIGNQLAFIKSSLIDK